MIPLPSLTGGRSREHSRLAKASVENIIMSFDKFLLAVESRDLSQADKSIKRVFSFPN